ncbi:MAG: sigma-70 family RNA polymerase sigma factor [Candidatus Zixiibacteriota bacterium]|nr:MAG: sigma-70 family RNA polymerase sigma factor [candidate division Zixibacteria bacterium]
MKDKKEDKRRGHQFVDHYNSSLSYGRKKRTRIRYVNRVTKLFGHLDLDIEQRILGSSSPNQERSEREELIDHEVRSAVEKLLPREKQFVELFHFQFRSYQEIARIMKKKTHKLERLHQRALGKLRILLANFVKEQFKFELPQKTDCIICNSPFRGEMDELIKGKKDEETYARLIKTFRQKYGINVRTPQTIIGHRRKHMV